MILPKSIIVPVAVVALTVATPASAAPQSMPTSAPADLSKTARLQVADTAVDRYQILSKDEDFVFDFGKSGIPFANRKTFPALTGYGTSFSLGSLPACGMAFLHLHPRATELFALTSGHVHTEMVPEGNVLDSNKKQRVIQTDLYPGMMTIFPAGSFHTQVNPDCEPANFSAALTAEDFGISMVADQTFSLTDDIIAGTFGQSIAGEDIERVRGAIPGATLIRVEECLKKCGIQKR
ncbi:uncharacterized protein N7515_002210 [Penicillium bovifimosum]|uniref:Cupin type-1 domain-containing protein n=1 Tax=Penicillium bovifimosum TaxID=126998 RepID=A0A9W9HD75_9EURO|nr:uncharacterized protein N7515_002210 [Penicillium bovifimosum]KAJ5143423.1 hypothetical protein N7515_002210 [Penicillium bovifimosum]